MFRPSSFGTVRNGTKRVRYGSATNPRDHAMLAPFATLLFLTVLFAAVMLMAEMFFGASSRFAAALRGRTPSVMSGGVRVSFRVRRSAVQRTVLYARPQLRAAA